MYNLIISPYVCLISPFLIIFRSLSGIFFKRIEPDIVVKNAPKNDVAPMLIACFILSAMKNPANALATSHIVFKWYRLSDTLVRLRMISADAAMPKPATTGIPNLSAYFIAERTRGIVNKNAITKSAIPPNVFHCTSNSTQKIL